MLRPVHTSILATFVLLVGSTFALARGSTGFFRSSEVDPFTGRYTLMGDQSEQLRQAINRATDTMNFLRRRIARRQLHEKLALYPTVSLRRSGECFKTDLAGNASLSLPLSGAPVLWRAPFGETVKARLGPGPELREIFDMKQGRCEHRFRLSPDHRILTVEVKVTSNELPKPIEYRLVYQRA